MISDNSTNEDIFKEAAPPPYQAELDRCGFAHKLEFKPRNGESNNKKGKNSKKLVSWFNPPYSMDIETNVGNDF